MERMIKAGCAATSDFEWLSQLRFVFSREDGPFGMCSVRQTNCQLEYSYEYQVGLCVTVAGPQPVGMEKPVQRSKYCTMRYSLPSIGTT